MIDRLGNVVKIGDCVRYWHKVNGRPVPEVGEVIDIFNVSTMETVAIDRKEYNNTNVSYRFKSGITKLSKGEAMLWKMEQYSFNVEKF